VSRGRKVGEREKGDRNVDSPDETDDDCFYYHSWRNNVVIAFGTLSSSFKVLPHEPGATHAGSG